MTDPKSQPPSSLVHHFGKWATPDELTFIDHLGHWCSMQSKPILVEDKLWLLQSYQTGLSRRVRWDNLDREQVLGYVKREIDRLSALPSTQVV